MKVKNNLTGEIFNAEFSTEHAASSYSQPVLVLETGEAVDKVFYEILKDQEGEKIEKEITKKFRVDEYNNVYDEKGYFYCKWEMLTEDEREIVRKNLMSFK